MHSVCVQYVCVRVALVMYVTCYLIAHTNSTQYSTGFLLLQADPKTILSHNQMMKDYPRFNENLKRELTEDEKAKCIVSTSLQPLYSS